MPEPPPQKTPEEILALMKSYFEGRQPAEVMETFAEQVPGKLLKESLDIVDFLVHLEESLGFEIDLPEIGEAVMNESFGSLARQLAEYTPEAS